MFSTTALFLLVVSLLFVQSSVALCPTSATAGLGTTDFTSVAEDNLFQKLYAVATTVSGNYTFVVANGYVLRYPVNTATGDFSSDYVRLGVFPGNYPNETLTPGVCRPTHRAVCEPYAVSVDSYDRVWVADVYLRRVTMWEGYNTAVPINDKPTRVFGADTWKQRPAARNVTTSASVLNSPWYALYQTSADALWVIDYLGSTEVGAPENFARLLRYDKVDSRGVFGGAADAFFGVASFTEVTSSLTFAGTVTPGYLALDQLRGTLYLSDPGRNRVKVIKNAASFSSNALSGVLYIGQADGLTGTAGASANQLNAPNGLFYDSNNDVLYIADRGNNRVVGVSAVSTLTSSAPNFTRLIGQSEFRFKNANKGKDAPTKTTLSLPYDVNYNAATNTLFVADDGNGRVLSYKCDYDPSFSSSYSTSLAPSLTRPATPSRSVSRPGTVSRSMTKAATLTRSITKAASVSKSVGASEAVTSGTTGSVLKRRFRQRRQYF